MGKKQHFKSWQMAFPLSPILFLFYNALLLEALYLLDRRLSALGFADDISLLTYSESTVANCTTLESAHDRCLDWASTHGMRFAAQKYTLTHFTRRRNCNPKAPIRIDNEELAPSPVVRILGLQLDTRLCWKAHTKAVDQKMRTQMHALGRTTASTWDATMEKAPQIYLAVVRPALWHWPAEKRQKDPAAKLQKH